jgi:hypothetical protein
MLRRRGIGRAGRPSLVGTVARTAVVAGTASAVVGASGRRQQARADQAAQQTAQQTAQAAADAADLSGANHDRLNQLERLAQFHQQGILSDEEFASEKTKLLSAS